MLAVLVALATAPDSRRLLAAAPGARIVIVSPAQKTCQVVATAAANTLRRDGHSVQVFELPDTGDQENAAATQSQPAPEAPLSPAVQRVFEQIAGVEPALVISLGQESTEYVLKHIGKIPVVFSMVPNVLDSPLLDRHNPARDRMACIAIDVSPAQQVDWIHRFHPQAKNIGILHSDRSRHTLEAVRAAAVSANIRISAIETSRDEFTKAIDALGPTQCDGVLMIPDAKVYNLACVKRALLWGLRQKKAVWAFSDSLAKAGACGSIFVDYEAVGRQAATVALHIIAGEKPAAISLQYPGEVRTAVNERTAELIGLSIPKEVLEKTAVRYGRE